MVDRENVKKTNKKVTKKTTKKAVVITKKVEPKVELDIKSEARLSSENRKNYLLFRLFYSFLKASKNGKTRQGGWMANELRIKQSGLNYTLRYKGKDYNISEDDCDDISDIILYFI